MLVAMAEGLWDDQSWSFPILEGDESGGKMLMDTGNSEAAAKDVEAPPPAAAKGKKRSQPGGGDGESDDHELHIWTERERRKKMRNMFASLHSLIPHLPARADKSTIVDEAVLYIKKLELTLSELERQKAQILKGKSSANPTVCDLPIITQQNLAIQSREAFLAEQGSTPVAVANPSSLNPLFPAGPELPAATFRTWTSPNVILNVCGWDAHISISSPKKPGLFTPIFFVLEKYKLEVVSAQVSSARDRRMCMIHARANGGAEQFPETMCLVEEVFKQAAVEIMLWVNS
ncbi:transcription factor bHLH95-like [Sesamum indicum]|uniref:Transcription factor bHLH95-like n=1 Tax=Sesamum indicum TaxID=4182 RepID=A0A6I9TYP5_SESIN|nr:transcription factor bHLH95-like [Sesamum indicum]